jgi:hypothetical protein
MKMSALYMSQTADHLRSAGYTIEHTTEVKKTGESVAFERQRYRCCHGSDATFIMEALTYPDGIETYYMEITKIGSLRSFSFPLDSWKFRKSTVEFKYYIHPETGLGLSFILDLIQGE